MSDLSHLFDGNDEKEVFHKDLSYKIVGLAMQVHNELGFGFLEKIYENAMMILLAENEIYAQQQVPIDVSFHGQIIGEYKPDIIVERQIILELKSQVSIVEANKVQTLNYLKATNLKLAILLNFGKSQLEYKRFVS